MRMTRGWTGPRPAVVALLIGLATASGARGSTMTATTTTKATTTATATEPTSLNEYKTTGQVIPTSGVNPVDGNIIRFNSVATGSFRAPSNFSLGEFLVGALPAGVSTTYTNTPFEVNYEAMTVNGTTPDPNATPIKITGVLNGTVTGPNQSSVIATFDPISDDTFRTGDYLNTLKVSGSVLLSPSSNNGGRTTIQATLTAVASPIPEPATFAIFATALVGLGLSRRLRRPGR